MTGKAVPRTGPVPDDDHNHHDGGSYGYYPGYIYNPYYSYYYDPFYSTRYGYWSPYGYGYGLGYFSYDPFLFGAMGYYGGYDPCSLATGEAAPVAEAAVRPRRSIRELDRCA